MTEKEKIDFIKKLRLLSPNKQMQFEYMIQGALLVFRNANEKLKQIKN